MSRLKVILRGALISEIGLSPDREYIGGRKENCDIRLQPEKGISREHFNLKFEEGKWKLKSLSRFGEIFSLGHRIENAVLEHGQIFQVPPYEFTFLEINNELDISDVAVGEVSENEKTVIGVAQQMPYIKMLSSQGDVREMLRLEFGEIWVAGRDSSCQIIIPDQRVSRRQFEIRKINGIYTIIDMDSVNGTFLNGAIVSSTDPMPLKSGDAITVLDNTMYFELHDPNFQYRMDRIEIPPLQLTSDVEDVNFENISNEKNNNENINHQDELLNQNQPYEEIYHDNNNEQQQLDISGGPFTGIPNNSNSNTANQFYNFQPNQSDQKKPTIFQKFKANKPLMIASVLVFLGGAYFLSEYLNKPEQIKTAEKKINPGDPFSELTTAKQQEVQDLYAKAQAEMLQTKYDLAKDSLEKLHKILPTGYQDSLQILDQVIINEQTIIDQKNHEEAEKARLEAEDKIRKNVAECEKLITPDITEEKMSNCLSESLSINPEHVDVLRLKNKVHELAQAKKNKEQEKQSYEALVKELDKIYLTAESVRKDGYPYKAIKSYELVVKSTLPDPNKLKNKAAEKIKFIQETIKTHTENNLKNADQFIKDGKLKLAIKALNDALLYDPDNRTLKDKTEKYTNDLRLQAMAIYQESIIDESFGYVDGNETRPGAKDKWRKIIDLDSEDGEYYRKAYIKLKKYGVY